jgi:hypothetical protein
VGFTAVFKTTGSGNIDFAWIDDTKYTGELTYTPVVESFSGWDFWAFVVSICYLNLPKYPIWHANDCLVVGWVLHRLGHLQYNKISCLDRYRYSFHFLFRLQHCRPLFPLNSRTSKSQMARIHAKYLTGNPYTSFPQSIVDAWQSQVEGGFEYYDHFVFPCTATLPSFVVGIGNARFNLPSSIFNGGYYGSTADGVRYCWSLFFSTGSNDLATLGMPFLELLFVVYDVGNRQMGFGNNTGL